jgi:hypothetical protein
MMGDASDDTFSVVGEPERYHNKTYFSLLMLVSTVFGGIHCIGWSFDFPSHTEQLLWRISSVAITGIPLGIVVIGMFLNPGPFDISDALSIILIILLTLLYPISRVLLLVVSFTALRSLPSSAFQTVEWTTFLPHL